MHQLLPLIRKIKPLWIKYRIDRLVKPFSAGLRNIVNLSLMAEWISNQKKPAFNDFYSSKFDYTKRIGLYEFMLKEYCGREAITYLEFGVAGGQSFEWWVKHQNHQDSKFYGFDTFEGLPERWGHLAAGSMTAHGNVPAVQDGRAGFIKGLFQSLSGMYVNDANSVETDGYQLLNSTIGLEMFLDNFNILLSGGVNNLLDQKYVGFININSSNGRFYEAGEPRTFFASLKFNYVF